MEEEEEVWSGVGLWANSNNTIGRFWISTEGQVVPMAGSLFSTSECRLFTTFTAANTAYIG